MIQRVYEGAQKSRLDRVIVATDDQRIYDAVKAFGGEVVMTSKDHATGTDRCGEVAQAIESDIIINIQGDEPLVDVRQIDALCQAFEDETVQIATLGIQQVTEEDKSNPNRIKIVVDHRSNALYFSRNAIPSEMRAPADVAAGYPFYRHIGLYAYRSSVLQELVCLQPSLLEKMESLEQLRWLYFGYSIRVVPTDIETPGIDSPEDVEKVLPFL